MKYLKKYESYSQSEIDDVLDKINDLGYESLSNMDKYILENPDGDYKEKLIQDIKNLFEKYGSPGGYTLFDFESMSIALLEVTLNQMLKAEKQHKLFMTKDLTTADDVKSRIMLCKFIEDDGSELYDDDEYINKYGFDFKVYIEDNGKYYYLGTLDNLKIKSMTETECPGSILFPPEHILNDKKMQILNRELDKNKEFIKNKGINI